MWRQLLEMAPGQSRDEIDTKHLDENLKPQLPTNKRALYEITREKGAFLISNPQNVKHVEFKVEVDPQSKTGFKGLPPEFEALLLTGNISRDEVLNNPADTLQVLKFYNEGMPLPSQQEFEDQMEGLTEYIKDDPSKHYNIIKKIGHGGFGKIFLVEHKERKDKMALKYVDPRNEKERNIMKNEIGLMQIANHENLVKFFEGYYYRERVWMFIEYMDGGCLTPVVEDCRGNIPEKVIAYTMRECL